MSLDAYLRFFETMTVDRLHELDVLTTEDVSFSDPFNDLIGRAPLRRVFEDMFADLDEPRFTIIDQAGGDGRHFVRWRFNARRHARKNEFTIEGVSVIVLAADGRISEHRDYWDAAANVYERLPVLGCVLRRLRRRLAIDATDVRPRARRER